MSLVNLSEEDKLLLEKRRNRIKEITYQFPWEGPSRQFVKDEVALKQLDQAASDMTYKGNPNSLNEGGSIKAIPFVEDFEAKYPDLYKDLTNNIYPYGVKPSLIWLKYMPAGVSLMMHFDTGIQYEVLSVVFSREDWKEYYGTHVEKNTDKFPIKLGNHGLWIISTILAKKTDDLSGGLNIIGRDIDTTGESVRKKIEAYDTKKIGYGISWSEFTEHAVTTIESGERITLMIAKKDESHDASFWKKYPVSEEEYWHMFDNPDEAVLNVLKGKNK